MPGGDILHGWHHEQRHQRGGLHLSTTVPSWPGACPTINSALACLFVSSLPPLTLPLPFRSTVSRPQRLRLAPGGARRGSSARRALQIPFPRLLGTSARGRGTPWRPRACLEHGRSTIPGMAQMSAQSVQEATRARLKGHFIHGKSLRPMISSAWHSLAVSLSCSQAMPSRFIPRVQQNRCV